MYKQFTLIGLLLLSACGGGGDSSSSNRSVASNPTLQPVQPQPTQEARHRIGDAPDNLSQYCTLQNNDKNPVVFADEVIVAHCSGNATMQNLILDNLDYYKNIRTLHLGSKDSTLGNIDILSKLSRLRHLSIIGPYQASPDMWKQLKLISLSLSDSDLGNTRIPKINSISYLQILNLATHLESKLATLSQLRKLTIRDKSLNANYISNLKNLKTLVLRNNNAGSAMMTLEGRITKLPKLQKLIMNRVFTTDFSFIEGLTGLKSFTYKNLQAGRLSYSVENQLKCGTALKDLIFNHIGSNALPLHRSCNNLVNLNMRSNQLTDISSVLHLKKLKKLDLSFNAITDLSSISSLTMLETLDLDSNQISDISALSLLLNLKTIDLDSNKIINLTPLSFLLKLETLELDSNQIVDVSPIAALINLVNLDLSLNKINDISGLYNLPKLRVIDLAGNHFLARDLAILKSNLPSTEVIFH